MQANDPYRAIRAIKSPGMLYLAYNEGDGVSQSAVDNWELVVGVDVLPVRTDVIPRPEAGAPRPEWEAFAIGQGMSVQDAQAASLDDLRTIPSPGPGDAPEALPGLTAPLERPADDAVKAEWVRYVLSLGADETWANAKSTTKTDLMDFEALGEPQPTGN